jgi:hypothetical protein
MALPSEAFDVATIVNAFVMLASEPEVHTIRGLNSWNVRLRAETMCS